jgi:integrase
LPRQGRGPHLYLKKRPDGPARYYIRDGRKRVATGFGEGEHSSAVRELARYISANHTPNFGQGDPHSVSIASVIELYSQDKAMETARPRATLARLSKLNDFFGDKMVAYITPNSCKRFVKWWGREQAARRALEDLRAALTYAWRCRKLSAQIPVDMPLKAASRERWLTRSEAAKLLRSAKRQPHLARFIVLGLYSGTRAGAILATGWRPHPSGGYLDLENRVLYRKAAGERETTKRRPPMRIEPRLLAHLSRWRRSATGPYVIEWEGKPVKSIKRSWARARAAAGLGPEVTPHTLRHTFVTWKLQAGVPIWVVAGLAGMSPRIVESVYGHHATAGD